MLQNSLEKDHRYSLQIASGLRQMVAEWLPEIQKKYFFHFKAIDHSQAIDSPERPAEISG